MPFRTHSFSGALLSLVALLTALAAARPAAQAQHVHGAIGVSATILPPTPTRSARLIAFDVERDGIVTLETTPPSVGSVSQIVMSTVSSSANEFVPVEQAPMLVETTQHRGVSKLAAASNELRAARMRFDLDPRYVEAPSPGASARDVTVRVSYLIVPGT